MPLYRCLVREGSTTKAQREHIAREIVRVHCGVTGAPPSFVHAFFAEAAPGELADDQAALVFGSIRSGRTDEQKGQIVSALTGSIARILDQAPSAVAVFTADVPSKWNMEGGELLPEPGEEAEWLERHR